MFEQQPEFITAKTGEGIPFAELAGQNVFNSSKKFVAGYMTCRVVDMLEPI
jgi:hypothetical protein